MKAKIISILKLAIPAMISSLSGLLMILVCTRLLGTVDASGFYLLAVFLPINYVMIALYESIRAASLTLSSVAAYQGNLDKISLNMASLIVAILIIFLVFLSGFFVLGSWIGNWIGVAQSEQQSFMLFSSAMLASGIVTGIAYVFTSTCFSMKKPFIGMCLALLSAAITCFLTYYLRQFILPTWLSYVLSSLIASVICLFISWVVFHHFGVYLFFDGFKRINLLIKNLIPIIQVGGPVLFSSLTIFSSLFFINATLSHFSSVVLTGYSIAYRIQNIAILPAITMGTAIAILSSRARVEGDKKEENEIQWNGLSVCFLCYLLVAIVIWFFKENLINLVTSNIQIIHSGSIYLKIVALTYIFMGPNIAYLTILEQSGFGVKSFFINVFYFLLSTIVGCTVAIHYQNYEYLYIIIAVINVLFFIYILTSLLMKFKLKIYNQSNLEEIS